MLFFFCHFSAANLGLVDLLPFFNQNADKYKQNESFQHIESSEFAEDTLGVPTHFENDGSALYLLTHALAPPPAVAVGQWLTQQTCSSSVSGINNFLHKFSSIVFIDFLTHSIILGHSNHGDKVPSDQEGSQEHTEALPFMAYSPVPRSASEHTTAKFAVDTVMVGPDLFNKEDKHVDDWHDFSQISAGDEKDKLTPLSQIGFRDPASTGDGQQLTILSIEVLLRSLFFRSRQTYLLFSSFLLRLLWSKTRCTAACV